MSKTNPQPVTQHRGRRGLLPATFTVYYDLLNDQWWITLNRPLAFPKQYGPYAGPLHVMRELLTLDHSTSMASSHRMTNTLHKIFTHTRKDHP